MLIRKITKDEKKAAELISASAFHFHIDDIDSHMREQREYPPDDWGAFNDEGVLMSHVIDNDFETYFDGSLIKTGGIGAVSTLPEYRNSGAVRQIITRILEEDCKNGKIMSMLMPFSHEFYRKFGFETICVKNVCSFPPSVFSARRFNGRAVSWDDRQGASDYVKVYERFASDYNFMAKRDERKYLDDILQGEPHKSGIFCYMLYEGGPVAYLRYKYENNGGNTMKITDLAWDGAKGFAALTGFIGRFTADYDRVVMPVPTSIDLCSLASAPYDIEKKPLCSYMARPIDTAKILEVMKKPPEASFVIQVNDKLISRNNGTWRTDHDGVTASSDAPDIIVSERALAQLSSGAIDLREASYRDDVKIIKNEYTLESVFVHKPLFTEEDF